LRFEELKIMPKKKEVKVGALVKCYRRKVPGLGLVLKTYTRQEAIEEHIQTWQYKKVPDATIAKIKWFRIPSCWDYGEPAESYMPESWLRVVSEAK